MKIQVIGLQRSDLISYIKKNHPKITIVEKDPELIICYGGDGTLLYGERMYPGVPKVLLRNSLICNLCAKIAKDEIPQLLLEKKFTIVEHIKLEGSYDGKSLKALNDIVVAHPNVNGTLRAIVYVNGKKYGGEILGDGLIIATPIGSTGYFQSITRSNFQTGIALAFNNSVKIINHVVLKEDSKIEVEVTRGPGVLAADNDEDQISLTTGDKVRVEASGEKAQLVEFNEEYERFNVTTSTNRVPLGFCQICKQNYD
ncbi:MAG: hypothetical protein ABIG66_04305 [Candidatus Kerfeldbacteria bacterium]